MCRLLLKRGADARAKCRVARTGECFSPADVALTQVSHVPRGMARGGAGSCYACCVGGRRGGPHARWRGADAGFVRHLACGVPPSGDERGSVETIPFAHSDANDSGCARRED